MQIIKEGKLKSKKYKFECSRCGCIFIADRDEITSTPSFRNDTCYKVTCPCCKIMVYGDEKNEVMVYDH